ncbi:helix-turn-helix domain-containing protein [Mycolicibacterium palauense]|uniref:helix-turn-helix domain-containing protein n=1 Tax=Mycolicibacterium palauense TaxID=2034511 RepID=UPI000BFEEE15|nr:helix-turn-helix transcriptional regulator [Mycolicibacterium palauense]
MTRKVMRGFDRAKLTQARIAKNLSVADLARLTGISVSALHKWEAGQATPQIDFLVRIMATLKTPIDQVVTIDPADRYPGDWRVIRGLTQPQLAAAARIATSTLRGIERGEKGLSDANAETLAQILGISTAEYRQAYEHARQRPPGTTA